MSRRGSPPTWSPPGARWARFGDPEALTRLRRVGHGWLVTQHREHSLPSWEARRSGRKRQVHDGGDPRLWHLEQIAMELARSCHYAIRGLVFLASRERSDEPVLLRDIAEAIGGPEAFLSKIFQSLRASAIVRSHRGTSRGYGLARDAAEISLYDVIVATEGQASLHTSRAVAEEAGGSFANVWTQVEAMVASRLRSTTIKDLVSLSRKEGSLHTAAARVDGISAEPR